MLPPWARLVVTVTVSVEELTSKFPWLEVLPKVLLPVPLNTSLGSVVFGPAMERPLIQEKFPAQYSFCPDAPPISTLPLPARGNRNGERTICCIVKIKVAPDGKRSRRN